MPDLVAVTFSREADGGKALESIRGLEKAGKIHLIDTAVVSKDPDGKVHRKDEMASGTESGIAVGAMLGALLFVLFPVGVIGGAVVGGLIGRSVLPGLDGKFVTEVADDLRPGGSALFLLIREAEMGLVVAAMRPYQGTVRQTTLSDEDAEALEQALKTAH
jgi:uncharacterized membrane protein